MNHSVVPKTLTTGYVELILAQCCVGIGVVSGKYLISLFPAIGLLLFRFAIAFAGMCIVAQYNKVSVIQIGRNFMQFSHKNQLLLIFQAACGGVLFNILILSGMKTTSAMAAGIISSITPVMIFVLSTLLLRETITLQKLIAVGMVSVGLLVLNKGRTHGTDMGSLIGNFLVFLAVIPEALFVVLSKIVSEKITWIEAALMSNFFNFWMVLPFVMFSHDHFTLHCDVNIGWHLLIYGTSGSLFFFLFWYRGLSKIPTHTAALFTGVMPISTTLLAIAFLHERLYVSELLGMLLVIAAIFVGCKSPRFAVTSFVKEGES